MRNSTISAITLLTLLPSALFAQETYLPDKNGEWHVSNRIPVENCQYISDKQAFSANLISLAEWIHKNNQVTIQPKGFNAQVNLSGLCQDFENSIAYKGYGNQGSIYIKFQLFSIENGKEKVWTDYCPNTGIQINNFINIMATRFNETGYQTGDAPELRQPLEKALENLKQYWMVAPLEKEFAPGVRLYAGGHLLVFNPDRPEFWIPVTVKEIMEARLAYYKIKQEIDLIRWNTNLKEWAKMGYTPNESSKPCLYDLIKKEFDAMTPLKLNSWAYSSGEDGISGINAESKGNQVMKFNSECWDRTLPKAAVQFIYIQYTQPSEEELNNFFLKNKRLDYVGLFMKAMPVEKLASLINKK
jgi:hypothetical protein